MTTKWDMRGKRSFGVGFGPHKHCTSQSVLSIWSSKSEIRVLRFARTVKSSLGAAHIVDTLGVGQQESALLVGEPPEEFSDTHNSITRRQSSFADGASTRLLQCTYSRRHGRRTKLWYAMA